MKDWDTLAALARLATSKRRPWRDGLLVLAAVAAALALTCLACWANTAWTNR